jgi:hypothetical protein
VRADGRADLACSVGAGGVLTSTVEAHPRRRAGGIAIGMAALLAASSMARAAPPTAVDPASLFEGRSEGRGTLTLGFGRPRPYTVENRGHRDADGTFRLDQVVRFEGEAPQPRHWVIRNDGEGRYTFTLSDAAGPGIATTDGRSLRLRYAPRHGLRMHQMLSRNADGTIANAGTVRMLGIPVGHLSETITPLPDPPPR